MTLQLLHSKFPYIRGKFDFLFFQCMLRLQHKLPAAVGTGSVAEGEG
jgi:hypothetical protein